MMKPERTDTNIRIYTKDDLKYLLNVSILYDNGFKISKIARMTNTELSEEVTRLSLQSVPFTTHVSGLVMAMVELNEDQFEKILSTVILSFGLEETMIKVMFPFLQHVGILWLTNTINPAQEHFISNLIRQKANCCHRWAYQSA